MTEGDNSHTITYAYDSQDQLIRENNEDENYTHTWTYNAGGNITRRNRYSYTSGELDANGGTEVAYSYPTVTDSENNTVWGDLLTGYGTKTVTYDQIGNPETFGARAYTWEHGRQLKSLEEGNTTWNYTYDAGGMRTGRTDGTTANTYTYIYTGSQLTQMKKGNDTLTFTYDASGIPLTVTHGSNKYYYATNLQGDVVAILNAAGSAVAGYTYDAWGNCTVTGVSSIAELNPLRYRGYVYDQETKLYYLQSRYYDPEVGRFLNADSFTTTGQGLLGNNMFAYCHNNPILYVDPSGYKIILPSDATEEQIAEYERAIAYLKTSKTGEKLILLLENSEVEFYIAFTDDGMEYNPQTHTIYFNTNCGLLLLDGSSVMSPALGLAHEMGHAAQDLDGTLQRLSGDSDTVEALNLKDYEIPIANELGEPVRNHYRAERGPTNMRNSTHFRTTYMYEHPWWYYLAFWNWFKPDRELTDHNL